MCRLNWYYSSMRNKFLIVFMRIWAIFRIFSDDGNNLRFAVTKKNEPFSSSVFLRALRYFRKSWFSLSIFGSGPNFAFFWMARREGSKNLVANFGSVGGSVRPMKVFQSLRGRWLGGVGPVADESQSARRIFINRTPTRQSPINLFPRSRSRFPRPRISQRNRMQKIHLPDVVLLRIFAKLTFNELHKLRKVCFPFFSHQNSKC